MQWACAGRPIAAAGRAGRRGPTRMPLPGAMRAATVLASSEPFDAQAMLSDPPAVAQRASSTGNEHQASSFNGRGPREREEQNDIRFWKRSDQLYMRMIRHWSSAISTCLFRKPRLSDKPCRQLLRSTIFVVHQWCRQAHAARPAAPLRTRMLRVHAAAAAPAQGL